MVALVGHEFRQHLVAKTFGCLVVARLTKGPAHPFYRRLNQILGQHGFDEYVERAFHPQGRCRCRLRLPIAMPGAPS